MEVNNMSYDSKVYDLIKKGLDATSLRSKVISNNIANINTKGYKKYYVSFEDTLKNNINSLQMEKTDKLHIGGNAEEGTIKVEQDNATSMREDGNNVDIDMEMSKQAENTLMYNAMISQINSKISMTRSVITGGGR